MAMEWRASGDDRYADALTSFADFLDRLEREGDESRLSERRVPSSHFWLLDGTGRVLACSRLRHRLVPQLEREGGHIGYDVRPSARRRGVGTRLLAYTLDEARTLGIERVLVTCDHDNHASARVIEKNGGVEIEPSVSDRTGQRVRRFWIDLT